jgi:serine/threonine-protein kinase
LLRTRLRLATLIILGACVLYFVRNLWDTIALVPDRPMKFMCLGGLIAVLAVESAILWSPRPLSMKSLRFLELTMFGAMAAYFGWLQFALFPSRVLLNLTAEGENALVLHLASAANAFRWLLLIVLYGTFVPNTWRRCALVVGSLALAAILLTAAMPLFYPAATDYLRVALPDTVIIVATATAIAVFGSYKIRELHEKAHEAQKFGQYRLKQVLGFGGMGAVYLAEHIMLRRPCAIKVIRPDQAGDPRTLMRFEREVRATATLTHWNTVEIYDYGHAEDGTFYYVMEYLPGLNLEDLVERHGPMPPERAVHFIRQVCQALREAHSIGLIHRDIKPSNIFACERGKVYDVAKLLDFGLVKKSGIGGDGYQLTQEGSFAGSPAFVSPEQAAGREQLDARSDIYNVGAVAYFLITGDLLFERESPLQMLHAHAYEPIVPNGRFQEVVPADLQQVILRCLEKDADRRYQDAASLDASLAACQSSGLWTMERAEEWWRQRQDAATPASFHEEHENEGQTIPA